MNKSKQLRQLLKELGYIDNTLINESMQAFENSKPIAHPLINLIADRLRVSAWENTADKIKSDLNTLKKASKLIQQLHADTNA